MSVSNWFEEFCKNLRISDENVSNIKSRYKKITKRINLEYYNLDSETQNSLYVGSYGRGTDIIVSDIDVLLKLPYETYKKFNQYQGNGQSALLQEVKSAIQKTYSKTHLRGDGQVIVIKFSDGIIFEIVPAFVNNNGSFTYPDTSNNGSWKVTNPKPEISEMNDSNKKYNKNLKRLCRMTRAWKYKWNVPIGGLLIDTLAYKFIESWEYNEKSYLYYDYMSRDFFEFLKSQNENQKFWYAVGSNQKVYNKGIFQYKAKRCFNISLDAIEQEKEFPKTAKSKWREIYGGKFPN